MSGLSRRQLFQAGAASGALLLASPAPGLAAAPLRLGGASRRSRLFPKSRRFLVHADLHNHSLLSGDAVGDPDTAYQQLRADGLDAATLTEHAVMGHDALGVVCPSGPCKEAVGINENDWQRLRVLANNANKDGAFTAFRAFEWTTPTMGHVNVWFGSEWIDGMRANAIVTPRGGSQLDELGFPVPQPILDAFEALPDTAHMDRFYDWLARPPGRGLLGGGRDALAGFNHPNEYGNFDNFDFDRRIVQRMVTCEALNDGRDFFFYGVENGMPHPLAACLDAGWRTGFIGVGDYHGDDYREANDRGGLWVRELSRAGVREALLARRVFATRLPELRLDAAAGGVPMGSTVPHRRGPLRVAVDIDGGPAWAGKPVTIQVIRPGRKAPTLASVIETKIPRDNQPLIRFDVDVDVEDGTWMFLRITDPTEAPDDLTPKTYAAGGKVIGYTSPFFFERGGRSTGTDDVINGGPVSPRGLPATGSDFPSVPLGAGAAALTAAALLRLRATRMNAATDGVSHPHPHPH